VVSTASGAREQGLGLSAMAVDITTRAPSARPCCRRARPAPTCTGRLHDCDASSSVWRPVVDSGLVDAGLASDLAFLAPAGFRAVGAARPRTRRDGWRLRLLASARDGGASSPGAAAALPQRGLAKEASQAVVAHAYDVFGCPLCRGPTCRHQTTRRARGQAPGRRADSGFVAPDGAEPTVRIPRAGRHGGLTRVSAKADDAAGRRARGES